MRKALTLLACLLTSTPVLADAWPRYGGPGGDFRLPAAPGAGGFVWSRALGPGTCGVVSDSKRLYTMYAIPKESGTAAREMTAALDLSTGRTVWEDGVEVELLAKQESFSGSPMQPQATPVLDGGRLFTLGFTGIVQARDAGSGRLLWAADLVSDHGADPVQFGFAASPVIYEGRLLVHSGGAHAVIAFDPADGHVLWQSAAAAPSYATPTVLQWDGLKMVVQLTRDALFGFDLASGKTLWHYSLPKPGLTNVPTPISLPGRARTRFGPGSGRHAAPPPQPARRRGRRGGGLGTAEGAILLHQLGRQRRRGLRLREQHW